MKAITIHHAIMVVDRNCPACGGSIASGEIAIITSWWDNGRNEFAWYCLCCCIKATDKAGEILSDLLKKEIQK